MSDSKQTTNETLYQFTQQLQAWSHDRLEQQPGPFRQAELLIDRICNHQLDAPPLVYWVNRDSFLAGALILVPQKEISDIFDAACETAQLLGLPCFFSWGRREICCWSTAYQPPEKIWEYEIPDDEVSSPTAFRKSFNLLFDRAEQLFFEHQLQLPVISDLYLANLLNSSYKDLFTILHQSTKLEQTVPSGKPFSEQDLRNNLVRQMLLPLASLSANRPVSLVTPEAVNSYAATAIDNLPEELASTWKQTDTKRQLPASGNRRFSHYISRIHQLRQTTPETLSSALHLCIERWQWELGGRIEDATTREPERMTVNAVAPHATQPPAVTIAPAGLLTASALVRNLAGLMQSGTILTDPLFLREKQSTRHIRGILHADRKPDSREQKELNALLRISWPNHKLTLAAKTPLWVWQLFHLCGLASVDSTIELTLPKEWLWERYGEQISTLLSSKFRFTTIEDDGGERLHCTLTADSDDTRSTTVINPDDHRRDLPATTPAGLRSMVIIALAVQDEIFQLLSAGALYNRTADQLSSQPASGIRNFLTSSLGRSLWQLLAPGRSIPPNEKLAEESARIGLPLPADNILDALSRIAPSSSRSTDINIDQELQVWLGTTVTIKAAGRQKSATRKKASDEESMQSFIAGCDSEELPVFPDNYIYNVPERERLMFEFNDRLKEIDTFFDEVILEDRLQKRLTVAGIRQAEALLLISTSRTGPVELPRDQEMTAAMLERYITDLAALREAFLAHAATELPSGDLTAAVDMIWKKKKLPDWNMVKAKQKPTF